MTLVEEFADPALPLAPGEVGSGWLRPLPPGYSVLSSWGFTGEDSACTYEFFRVYHPPEDAGGRGTLSRIDEDLSYWVAFWPIANDAGRPMRAKWLTFAQAREQMRGLTFARFGSPFEMRDELPGLMKLDGGASHQAQSAV